MKVYFGGWYQRTTLHLSEIYELLARGKSGLPLDSVKLTNLHRDLELESVDRVAGSLEYVKAVTKSGIEINYFEDGLYTLSIEEIEPIEAKRVLKEYFDLKLSPAIAYIFSLGAPTPKVLANIPSEHPLVVMVSNSEFKKLPKLEEVYSRIEGEEMVVEKTPKMIYLISSSKKIPLAISLVEMQIFFREFKDQLQKYLNIHRKIWEEISTIKERSDISGEEMLKLRSKLDSYQKTINLINSRINQMGAYVNTRAKVARESAIEEDLNKLFQYKFEVLNDTHAYIKEIWAMTSGYLNSAIALMNEIQGQATSSNITSLRVITTYGIIGGIVGYFSRDSFPTVTRIGVLYFFLLIGLTWILNFAISKIYARKRYLLKMPEIEKSL